MSRASQRWFHSSYATLRNPVKRVFVRKTAKPPPTFPSVQEPSKPVPVFRNIVKDEIYNKSIFQSTANPSQIKNKVKTFKPSSSDDVVNALLSIYKEFIHRTGKHFGGGKWLHVLTNKILIQSESNLTLKLPQDSTEVRSVKLEDIVNPGIDNVWSAMYYTYNHPDIWPQGLCERYRLKTVKDKITHLLTLATRKLHHDCEMLTCNESDLKIDISNPILWYPDARKLKRKVIMHVGPTNSGKTYNALKRLEESRNGYYAGPLRLLAREVYEKFTDKGIPCNLITGEEIIMQQDKNGNDSKLSMGTVGMFTSTAKYDVVVLDEIQMMGDPSRGWSWTAVFLSAQCPEIHMCGEERTVNIVSKICAMTGDELVVKRYKRLGELKVESSAVPDLKQLKPGDCLVQFSKRAILEKKLLIERKTGMSVAVIYGALPPDTRSSEAKKFNTGKAQVLVASDAIGMGINLSIRRIIFGQTSKFNGVCRKNLTVSEIKQIAGRAGRYNPVDKSKTVGYVTATDHRDVKRISRSLQQVTPNIPKAGTWPPDNVWAEYIAGFPSEIRFNQIFEKLDKEVKSTKNFSPKSLDELSNMSYYFQEVPMLAFKDKIKTLNLPLSGKESHNASECIVQFLQTIEKSTMKTIFDFKLPLHLLASPEEAYKHSDRPLKFEAFENSLERLQNLEELYRLIMIYCWLSYRYPKNFLSKETAHKLGVLCEFRVTEVLDAMKGSKKSL